MTCQQYIDRNFSASSLHLIGQMNLIVQEYMDDNSRLTARQLYYQLVARDIVENTERSYKRVTSIVNDAKEAGLMDWEAIEDRTRAFITRPRWDNASHLIASAASQFHMDLWANQRTRVFCIIEKEALVGVLEGVCHQYDVPLLAARGYPSGTVLREFCVGPLLEAIRADQYITIFHLGDHDPSGIDMTRDLDSRIKMFLQNEPDARVDLDRIALTMKQINQQKPPPNPAKQIDPRFASYQADFGTSSWELDALKPAFLRKLVEDKIDEQIDTARWIERREEIDSKKAELKKAAQQFAKKGI